MTYIPPVNGGRINATISGNTAGAGALVSTGTMTLAGGNNITLSQAGNAITISGGAAGGGSNTLGMSNLGNTSGTSGVISGSAIRMLYAGGNNVTLSQSINASSGTITISAANQTIQTQNLHNVTLSGNTAGAMAHVSSGTLTLAGGNNVTLSQNGNAVTVSAANQTTQTQNLHNVTLTGNTAGAMAQISSGTLTLAGGNNVTLSQNGNAVTVSAANQTTQTQNLHNVTLSGNTAGAMAQISSGTLTLAGGNNVTLSQNGNAVTVSAASQTVQTQNLHNVTLSGNTAGVMAHISSGTLSLAGGNNITLSQNGNAVSIIGGAGGGGGGIALANTETTFTSGTANLVEGGGAITIASTTGQSFRVSVPQTSSLSVSGRMSISVNASTISLGVPYDVLDFYQNMDRGNSATLATGHGTIMLQRLNQENNGFAANLTANTALLNLTANITATSLSSSHTVTANIAIYSDNATALTLINSASTSWALGASTANTGRYHGPRWLSFVSSQWSSAPVFSQGGQYVFAVMFRSSNYGPPMSYIGQSYMLSNQRSGTIGTTVATNTSLAHGNYWNAVYSATSSVFPTGITSNQVNRNNATAVFFPHLILNNLYSGTF